MFRGCELGTNDGMAGLQKSLNARGRVYWGGSGGGHRGDWGKSRKKGKVGALTMSYRKEKRE